MEDDLKENGEKNEYDIKKNFSQFLLNMEDDLKKIRNGRRPPKKRKTTSKKEKKEDDLKKKYKKKLKTTLQKEMEDDPSKNEKWKTTSKNKTKK